MSLTEEAKRDVQVFCSYAHEDQRLRERLEKHLKGLQRQGRISSWHDRKISAGREWASEIDNHLNTADIILLLISPDFMASDYCDIEVKRAMERHEAGEAHVIPIIIRPVYWEYAPFSKLQALPTNAKPVTSWRKLDEAFLDITIGIRNTIEELVASREHQKASEEVQKFTKAAHYFTLATEAYKIGDNRSAIELYLRVLQLQPNNTRVLERIGRAYSNLSDSKKAIKYLMQALAIDPTNIPALRSLALIYRYSDKEKAIEYLNLAVKTNPSDNAAWDFLGLLYRDEGLIDKAIFAHEQALAIEKRPETEYYLSILYALKGDKRRAKYLMLSAYERTLQEEHHLRIREVWKILIHAGVPIVNDNKYEALKLIESMGQYITPKSNLAAIKLHLYFLLKGTGHKEWISEFEDLLEENK